MTEKYIPYRYNGEMYDIPESKSAEFEKNYPSATIEMHMDGEVYDIPISRKDDAIKRYGSNITYSFEKGHFDKKEEVSTPEQVASESENKSEMEKKDRTGLFETIGKAGGAAGVTVGKIGVDTVNEGAKMGRKMPLYGNPLTGLAATIEAFTGKSVLDEDTPLNNASIKMGEVAEKLSKEADPTHGEKGLGELLKEGKVGMAAQKALAMGIESLPIMLASSAGPIGMVAYGTGMAASNYADDSRENPEIEDWKRGIYAVGTAATEMLTEKIGGPLKNVFGLNGGKITQAAAKEAIEQLRKEGAKTIKSRILNVLKTIGKEGLEEGGEEIITSFGNDALGEALDIIEGNKDYGIRAQWKKYKEQNPDATIEDFAGAKGNEYLEAFLGGLLSGAEISSLSTTAKEVADVKAHNNLEKIRAKGTQLNYGHLYDADDSVKKMVDEAAKSFEEEGGEVALTREFIEELTAEDAYMLSRREDVTPAQKNALANLAGAKAMQEGLNQKLDERINGEIAARKILIDSATEDGSVVTGTYNGRNVFVKGGTAKNGKVTLKDGQNGPVIIIDSATGEQTTVRSEEIASASSYNAEAYGNNMEQAFKQLEGEERERYRNTMSPLAKLNSVRPYSGKKILINLGNGVTEVYVQHVSPKGEVLIKGKKGDLGGQSFLTLNSSTFYDSIHRDAEGNPTITDVGKEEQEQYDAIDTTEPTQTPEADVDGTEDFKEKGTHTILIAGKPVEVEVTYQDNASDTVNYEYVDENGNRKVGSTTVGGFKAAIQQAEQYKPTESPAPENENPTPVEPTNTNVPAETTQAPTEVPVTPETIDWDALFENDAEAYFTEMQNHFGDKTAKRLGAVVAATQKKLDALNKATPETDNEIFENEEKKEKLEAKIEALNGMIARLSAEPVSEVAPTTPAPVETAPVQPMAPTTVQPEGNIPDVSVDKAADARARGFRMTNGQRVDRRGETTGVYGNDTDVTFTSDSKGKRTGKVKVIDAGNLVPSHIGGVENVEHFLPEAQPKKRTDAASTVSATLIAQNMDNPKMTNVASSAYEGAPIVNKRGEVIQGNNRSAAIIEMYQAHQQKAAEYKQYLIDHAAEFGLNADEVAAMQNPVLVRELDVDDADAITLGQYTMQDMESGGSQMIDSGRAIAGLSNKGMLEDFIARLLSEENEETSDMNLSDLITRNGNEALKMLYQNGIINQTQYQSALGANGRITADARAALRGIVEQQLFAGGIDNLSVMFEVLPDKAKKAIMQTISRDLKNPDDAKVTPYLQEAIEIYYQLNQQPDFVAAKTEEEVVAAIELFKGQTSLEEAGTPAEKYSNFAFELAKSFKVKTLKQQREYLNALYDAIAGVADIFGEYEGKTLSEAVEGIYGTNLNRGNNETNGKSGIAVLEGGNGGSQEGQQGSTENVGVRPETGESGQGTTNGGANPTVGGGTQTTGEVTPVAPIPVANPVDAAKSKERHLKNIIARYDLTPEHKYDLAVQIGKEIGDFFATIEEYEAFEAYATDFGAEYNRAVKEGVDKSFAERAQNTGNSQENGVSLGTEPSGGNNGTEAGTETPESTEGYNGTTGGQHTDDEGGEEGTQEAEGLRGGDTNQEIKYPARNGDATRQLLMDTFGFVSVSPGISQENLNHIYDFLMEMSKMLGISPTSISHGATLGMGVLGGRSSSTLARYEYRATWDGTIKEPYIRFKNSLLSSIAHEWWHSLDQVLSYYETGRGKKPATTVSANEFTGRPEVLDAIREVLKAINKSGHKERLETEYKDNPDYLAYSKRKKELAARFFEGYIKTKFAEAGIVVNGFAQNQTNTPTAEELKPVIPAFDRLFKVLKEKEGKKEGSTVLYHIGQEVDQIENEKRVSEEANQLATETALTLLKDNNLEAEIASDEMAQDVYDALSELSGVEMMTAYHGSGAKFEQFDHSHMGEGEGAQAHGWGTYVALNKSTSEGYASRMSGGNRVFMNERDVTELANFVQIGGIKDKTEPIAKLVSLLKMDGNVDRVREYLIGSIDMFKEWQEEYNEHVEKYGDDIDTTDYYYDAIKLHERALEYLNENSWSVEQVKAQLYTVEIPEDNDSNYLSEDGQMSEGEVERLAEACDREGVDFLDAITPEINDKRGEGKQVYSNLTRMLGSKKAASEFLSRAGFIGIKYHGRADGYCRVIFKESDIKITDHIEFYQTPDGTIYGWTDGKKIYLTKAGINPNTPIHEYTHLWAKAMMQKNPKGWNSIKQLLKKTPVWNEVMNDANYSNIHGNEDMVASEVISRLSGTKNAAKLEQMAQQMIDEAKGTMRKAEARGLIQNIKDALNKFWSWVGKNLFEIENFNSIDEITDRVLWDLINKTDLGELSEGKSEFSKKSYGKEKPYGQKVRYTPAFLDDIYFRVLSKYHFGKDSSPYVYMDGYIMRLDVPDSEHLKYYRNVEKTDGFGVRFDIFVGNITEEEFNALIEDYERGIPRTKEALSELFEAYRKNRGSELSSDNVHIENIESDNSDGRLYGQASERKDERRTSVSRSNSYLRASEIDSDIFPISRINLLPKTSTSTKLDTEYFDAIEKGKKVRAENIIEDAANSAGYTEAVYHGTPSYGFTEFESKRKSGAIFTTTARNTAANYGGDGKYASVRKINKGIKEVKSAQDVLDNATSVLDQNWRLATHQEKSEVIARVEADAKKVSDKIQELKADFSNTPFELQEAIAWMENIIYDAAEGRENGNEGNSLSSMLIDGYKKFKESREFARQYIQEHYNELTPEQWSYWSYINGFEVGDVAIDAGYSMARAVSENDVATVDGKSFVFIEDLNEQTQKDKNVGTYKLYGNLGSNPLVIDAEKKVWFDLDFNGMKTTDSIAEWAKENGYTSVVFKNIYDYGDLSDVKVFFNPSQLKSADAITYDNDGNIIPPSERFNVDKNDIRYRKADSQNAAVDYLAGDARLAAIQNAVSEDAKKLNVSVTYKTRSEMPKGHQNDKGYYNPQTGEIVICTENATSIADAIQTILHEAVAHKGLRQLMGDKFNEFINRVYNMLDADTKAAVDKLAADEYDGNTLVALEEYMASLAENENFKEQTIWEKIKTIFNNVINKILGRNDIKIGDNELIYLLRASYNNMVNPKGMQTLEGWAKDMMMRENYGINEVNTVTPEILSRTGIDPTEVASETARQVYDKTVNETWQEFQRQFQDAYQPVRIAIDAIQQETGNVPIEDYENFLLIQNQMSSRSRVEIDKFQRRYYSPIISQVNAIIDTLLAARGFNIKDKAKRAEVYKEVINYLIAKHGIERNKYYQSTKTRKMTAKEMKPELDAAQADYQQKVDMINMNNNLSDAERELQLRDALDEYNAVVQEIKSREVPDMRDYSGLTSLFGLDSKEYEEAERMAQEMVDNFEKSLGRVDNEDGEIVEQSEAIDKMLEKINKATDKTLRHSYESGLLSRQQYNDIKAMFKFYIPLRGFDETTAEDIYSYARFEGNRFNPAVQTAKGRTSVADDPIAIIMNMAESEIAQGNKNRAKQALYNYLLNRTVMGNDGKEKQNSLMQVEDVWYVKGVDSEGNEIYQIATPDRSRGESWEEFEVRMQTMAEEGNAYKSKKGKLDVGMRFQKQRNQGAHYVYLKVNGVEKAIYINGDPKAADAINGTYKPEPIYKKGSIRTKNEKVNKVIEFVEDNLNLANLNRFISSTFTNYSLEFTARNYFRDMIYSHINIGIKESDPAYRKKFRQNWRHNNLRTVKNMLQAYKNGEYEGRPLTEDEAAFVEFMENGGQTGYTLINSVESRKRDLERAVKNMQNGSEGGGVKDTKAFKATLGAIELLNESSELVTRFAAFKTSRDMGRSINKSISDAKEITVNFNTKGAQDGKGLAGFIARYFGWSKYFFNASVQGVQNIKAMAEANKLKFCSTVGGIAGLGFCMPIIASALSELFGGDDDDENAYWNIPEYDRQNNLCIPVGNTYLKIPLPIGFREMYAIGDMVAAMAFDKKFTRDVSQVGMDIANKIASTVLPINPLESSANGLNFWHTFLYTALPSSAQFAIQNATNLDWKGVPLQKEYTYNEDDPQWMKAYASNPDWMVTVAKWCNENTQFGDYEGWDWSPEKLDNMLSNLFGGIYTIVKKTGKTISMAWNEENRTTSNIPLAGVVLGSGIGSDDMYMTDAYYDMLEYYDSNVNLIKRRAKQFGFDLDDVFVRKKGAHQPKMQKDVYSNPTFEWMQEWYKGNKELEKYDDNVKKLEKKIAESDKPSETNIRRLNRARLQFEQERREFINDMLELD